MSRYRHQYKNFGDAVLRSEWMVAEMRRRAEAVKAAAEALAPVGDPATDSHSGRYKDSFSVSAGVRKRVAGFPSCRRQGREQRPGGNVRGVRLRFGHRRITRWPALSMRRPTDG
jgi:hypothetical protein